MLGKVQELELKNLGNELFLFKFKSLEAGRKILEVGPWFVIGHPLVLQWWTDGRIFQREEIKSIPI